MLRYAAVLSFNSTLVQLKACICVKAVGKFLCFNSTLVQLKGSILILME